MSRVTSSVPEDRPRTQWARRRANATRRRGPEAIDGSAAAVRTAVAASSVGSGSKVGPPAVARNGSEPAAVARTVTFTPAAVAAGMVPNAQMTGRPTAQLPCVGTAETASAPAGISTRRPASREGSGPAFATRSASVADWPVVRLDGTRDAAVAASPARSPKRETRVLPTSAT